MRSRRSLLIGISPTRHARTIPARLTRSENLARFLFAIVAPARHVVVSGPCAHRTGPRALRGALLAPRDEARFDEDTIPLRGRRRSVGFVVRHLAEHR